jgi:hypothetical protein
MIQDIKPIVGLEPTSTLYKSIVLPLNYIGKYSYRGLNPDYISSGT